jgi:hypothetical protein
MPDDRRYADDEIEEIFRIAAEDRRLPRAGATAETGLTLTELQDIGREAGLSPERVADAARSLEARRGALPRGHSLGMPTAVGRIVPLPRAPDDREWALLVSQFRETFQATGIDRSQGASRHWSNGNLHIAIEPTETGTRMRLQTRKQNGEVLNGIGSVGVGMSAVLFGIMAVGGRPDAAFIGPAFMSLMSVGALAANAIRLPRWARTRESQMEELASRAVALLGAPPADR